MKNFSMCLFLLTLLTFSYSSIQGKSISSLNLGRSEAEQLGAVNKIVCRTKYKLREIKVNNELVDISSAKNNQLIDAYYTFTDIIDINTNSKKAIKFSHNTVVEIKASFYKPDSFVSCEFIDAERSVIAYTDETWKCDNMPANVMHYENLLVSKTYKSSLSRDAKMINSRVETPNEATCIGKLTFRRKSQIRIVIDDFFEGLYLNKYKVEHAYTSDRPSKENYNRINYKFFVNLAEGDEIKICAKNGGGGLYTDGNPGGIKTIIDFYDYKKNYIIYSSSSIGWLCGNNNNYNPASIYNAIYYKGEPDIQNYNYLWVDRYKYATVDVVCCIFKIPIATK